MIFDQTSQIRGISMSVVRCQHHSRTGQKRGEVSPQRDVECRCSLLQIDIFCADGVLILHPQDLVHDGVMRDRNALGLARGTRGEDHVGGIHITQSSTTISIGNDGRRIAREVSSIDQQHVGAVRRYESVPRRRQHTDWIGRREDVPDPLGGVIGIQWHVGSARGDHRVHTHYEIERPTHRQGHQRLGPNTIVYQLACQFVHTIGHLAIGQRLAVEHHGNSIGRQRNASVEQRSQCLTVPDVTCGGVARSQQRLALGLLQQIDVTHSDRRIHDHLLEDPGEPICESTNRRLVEQICGVCELGEHAVFERIFDTGSESKLKIEFRDTGIELEARHLQPRKLQRILGHVLKEQRDLEQRVMCLRSGGVQYLDQSLERNIAVAERLKVRPPRCRDECTERTGEVDRSPQDQRIHEHTDHIVERLFASPCNRSTDHDVTGTGQPCEKHGEGRMHHHEQRRVPLACE
ncbi:hypothetical protein B0E55_06322 [Rhodococcus sp. 66b]|nr:hypothetical protein B0E55_06322 [Rhodococcus sp. 66b]